MTISPVSPRLKALIFTLLCSTLSIGGITYAAPADTIKPSSEQSPTQATIKVNINTANAEQLSTALKGVGMSKAEAIIAYRNSYGPFKSAEELADVKGIGQATVAKNLEHIVLK